MHNIIKYSYNSEYQIAPANLDTLSLPITFNNLTGIVTNIPIGITTK